MVVRLLEIKEKLSEYYGKYETYLRCAGKFLLSLLTLLLINSQMGEVRYLKNPIAAVVLALICMLSPGAVIAMIVCAFIVIHISAISFEAAAVTAVAFVIMLLLYLTFRPSNAVLMVMVILACMLNISGAVAIPLGLVCSPIALLPVAYGLIAYGAISSVKVNYTVLEETSQRLTPMEKAVYFIDSVIKNDKILLLIAAFVVTILVVYGLRKLPYAYSWAVAIAAGAACYVLTVMIGNVIFGVSINIMYLGTAVVVGTVIAILLHIAYFLTDEAHAEYLQYEDDDYVYYVKAIPKYSLAKLDRRVKKITDNESRIDDLDSISFIDDDMASDDYFRG